jgi:hypothetical protein
MYEMDHDLNTRMDHLGFELKGLHVGLKCNNMEIGVNRFVTYNTYFVVVNGVKHQDSIALDQLISELKIHFPFQKFMVALGWSTPNIDCAKTTNPCLVNS